MQVSESECNFLHSDELIKFHFSLLLSDEMIKAHVSSNKVYTALPRRRTSNPLSLTLSEQVRGAGEANFRLIGRSIKFHNLICYNKVVITLSLRL
mmetsp:Transcript_32362/g.78357  ORF Transcript_32362/g.78357 Transcript_32362/m.78357 type:complete len:95 (-) Transcript_32362:81-365(-)